MSRLPGLKTSLIALGAALLALAAIGIVALWREDHVTVWIVALLQVPVYALAAVLVVIRPPADRQQQRGILAAILLVGLLMRLPLLPLQPVSTDLWRYIWDGRVQAAGINPYLHVPNEAALQHLRDETVFRQINRADYAPTIYPPTAQIVFFLVTRLGESAVVMKAAMLAFEGLAVWALLQLLAARGLPATRVLLYAWHPLAVWEFAGSAHVDIVAIAFMLLAFVAADRRSPFLAGAALAAGTIAKYVPIVTGPAIYRRWDWRLPVAFLLTALLLYAPYVGVGTRIAGFLPGYLAEEGFARGEGFYLWSLLATFVAVPDTGFALYAPFAALLLIALGAILFFRRAHEGADLASAMILVTTAVVLISPHYPWYFAVLVPFLCFHPVAAVVWLTGASTYLYFTSWPPTVLEATVLYGPFLLLLIAEAAWRRVPARVMRDERAVAA